MVVLDRLLQHLEDKQEHEEKQQQEIRVYNDIAFRMWYDVLMEDIFKHKQVLLIEQVAPFRIYDVGVSFMRFGAVEALTSVEDIQRFQTVALRVLRRAGYKVKRVRVYQDCVLLSF